MLKVTTTKKKALNIEISVKKTYLQFQTTRYRKKTMGYLKMPWRAGGIVTKNHRQNWAAHKARKQWQ